MTPFEFIGVTFAIIGLAQLVANERGVFGIFERLRKICEPLPELHDLVSCPYCLSVWLALGAAAWYAQGHWQAFLLYGFALIGSSFAIRRFSGLDHK